MKSILIFTLLGLTIAHASAQQTHLDIKVPDTVESDLFGSVKSTQTVYQKERFKTNSSEHTTREKERTYDEKGNLLTAIDIDIDDNTTNQTEFAYDSYGCLTGKIIDVSTSDTNETFSYTIDIESRQMQRKDLSTGEIKIVAYAPSGYEHYIEYRDTSNIVTKVVRVKRLPNNKEYQFDTFDGETNLTRIAQIKWNNQGLMREYHSQTFSTNGYIFITKYTHPKIDETGNWTKRVAKTDYISKGKKKKYSKEIAIRKIDYFKD